jgi:hypothetical protein
MVYENAMTKHRKAMFGLAAPLMLCLGAPAHAQVLSPDEASATANEMTVFERDVEEAATAQRITGADAAYLRGRAGAIRSFFEKISKDGLSAMEAETLRDRINYLRTRYNLQAKPQAS